MKALNHEITIMRAANHPKCIGLIEVIEDKQAVHLVEELASGGELFDRIVALGRFTEKDAVFLVHQVFDGIAYLHSIDIVHRDLKPENLLMVGRDESDPSYMQIKIADFGLSAMKANAKSDEEWSKEMREFCGTQDYLAPEVFKIAALGKKAGNLQYDAKVDVWSVGVIYYIMLCGYPPFYSEDNDMLKMIQQIMHAKFKFHSPKWDSVSSDSKDFIMKCLTVDTSKRPSAAECMKDPLFANNHVFSEQALDVKDDLREFLSKRRKKVLGAVKAIARMETIANFKFFRDPKDPTQREAERLFRTIDSLGNSNGFLELYEVILYIQEYMQHMFYKKNSMGDNVVDEKKLKDFASNLRNLVDTNKDGAISLEEFVQGFVTWKHFIEEQEKAS
mmetsp:Transcript_10696/g.35817  ORF Transcript_10696/g.35817 Transcript_10696/m.35817 type:complete len:390 (+) Transcript_10696:234-1403(+)